MGISVIFGQEPNLLGDNLLAWLTLALGAATVVGTGLAVIRPRESPESGELVRPPMLRSTVQIVTGLVATIWALATLLAA